MKVETHNHPTAISPYRARRTGRAARVRDEGATGRGAKPKARPPGFRCRTCGCRMHRARGQDTASPTASPALSIMLEGLIGGAAFNNEFGRPNIAGYFRSFELDAAGEMRGYHKPIMLAGGLGISARSTSIRLTFPPARRSLSSAVRLCSSAWVAARRRAWPPVPVTRNSTSPGAARQRRDAAPGTRGY